MWNILAETPSQITDWIGSGSSVGTLGITGYIAWFMLSRMQQQLDKMANAINNATKVALLQLLVHPRFPEEAKAQAQSIIDDVTKQ